MTDSPQENLLINGVPWFDDADRTVNAHGACIVEEGGRYYLFGEYRSDDFNAFIGFSCYSSTDLVNWEFERVVLPQQPDGLLGPDRLGERVKVMRCPSTGRFMMYMHTDDLTHTDAYIGLASCDTIAGEYTFHGALPFEDEPLPGWDMGTFQDADGTGYLLLHEGDVFRLSDDYTRAEEKVVSGIAEGGESPAMLTHNGTYFLLFSNKTSWERNDNYYLSAPGITGPWTHRGPLAPAGSLTYNSQCTFVLDLRIDGAVVHMYMGDRWSFPRQGSAATYVWQPLTVDGDTLTLGPYQPSWSPLTGTPADPPGRAAPLPFRSNRAGHAAETEFTGRRVAVVGDSDEQGGYGRVEILDGERGQVLHSLLVDFYSKVPDHGLRYVSPALPAGQKVVRVTATGTFPEWFDKARHRYGALDTFVTTTDIIDIA
jgi:hypothetical protein